jgi:hypothetical protein
MTSFAEFHGAGSSGRLDCVRRQIQLYENDYRASAFYRDFVEALRAGRRSGTDELTLQRCISGQKVDARRQNYADLKRGWLAMPELHLPLERIGSARWSVTGLTVTVNPELALAKADGTVIVLKLWLNKATPTPDAVRAMLWLLADQMPQLYSGGVPAVLDLRRHKLHTSGRRPYRKGYAQLLATEATGMGALWTRLIETA